MRRAALAFVCFWGSILLADIGLISNNAEHTWVLYQTTDGQLVKLAECRPPVVNPTRDCTTIESRQHRPQIATADFLRALQTRLRVFAVVNGQAQVDYLAGQVARLQAKINAADTPPTALPALRASLGEWQAKLSTAQSALAQAQSEVAANLKLYRSLTNSLQERVGRVVDEAEKLSDYHVQAATDETSLLAFLIATYDADSGAATKVSLPLTIDHSFDHAYAIALDPAGNGFAVTGSSNQYSRPDRYFASQLTFYGSDGNKLWEDVTSNFHITSGSAAMIATGPQAFAMVGDDGAQHGALRLVRGNSGAPQASYYYYPDYREFRSVARTAAGELLVSAVTPTAERRVVVLDAQSGAVLREAKVFAAVEHLVLYGAIATATGDIAAFGSSGSSYNKECLGVTLLSAALDKVKWQTDFCSDGWGWTPSMAVATANGDFAIAGKQVRSVPRGDRESDWDRERHRAVLIGLGASGLKTFEYASEEVREWGWMGYNGLAYNPKSGEIAAVGSFPYAGVADVFDRFGNFLAHAVSNDHHNTDFQGVALLPNGSFLISGTAGDYPGSGFVTYNAAYAVLKR